MKKEKCIYDKGVELTNSTPGEDLTREDQNGEQIHVEKVGWKLHLHNIKSGRSQKKRNVGLELHNTKKESMYIDNGQATYITSMCTP
jgi:hypothetical protein